MKDIKRKDEARVRLQRLERVRTLYIKADMLLAEAEEYLELELDKELHEEGVTGGLYTARGGIYDSRRNLEPIIVRLNAYVWPPPEEIPEICLGTIPLGDNHE